MFTFTELFGDKSVVNIGVGVGSGSGGLFANESVGIWNSGTTLGSLCRTDCESFFWGFEGGDTDGFWGWLWKLRWLDKFCTACPVIETS